MSERVTDERLAAMIDNWFSYGSNEVALDLRDCRAALESERARSAMLLEVVQEATRVSGGALSWLGSEFPNAEGTLDRFGGAVPAREDLRHLEVDLRWVEHEGKKMFAATDADVAAWIAARDAKVRSEALEEAAKVLGIPPARVCEGHEPWQCDDGCLTLAQQAAIRALAGEVKP